MYNDIADIGAFTGGWMNIDIDNDGVDDYQIIENGGLLAFRPYVLGTYNSNSILGIAPGLKYPFALSSGATISSAAAPGWVGAPGFQYMNVFSCSKPNSQWCGVTDKYLGLRFKIGTYTHYGWARLDVPLNSIGMTLYDFAWDATPGAAIDAGDTGILGVDDNKFNNVKIVALNKSIGLYNLTGNTNYNLFSITGQSVLKGSTDHDTYVIEANTVASGVYIMELKDVNTNAVIRKKIVL